MKINAWTMGTCAHTEKKFVDKIGDDKLVKTSDEFFICYKFHVKWKFNFIKDFHFFLPHFYQIDFIELVYYIRNKTSCKSTVLTLA